MKTYDATTPDMENIFTTRTEQKMLYALEFVNMSIKEDMKDINSEGEFMSHPYFPLFVKAAEPLIHRLVDHWYHYPKEIAMNPRNVMLAFGSQYRANTGGMWWSVQHFTLEDTAASAIEAWTEKS